MGMRFLLSGSKAEVKMPSVQRFHLGLASSVIPLVWLIYFSPFPCGFFTSNSMWNPIQVLSLLNDYFPVLLKACVVNWAHMGNPGSSFYLFLMPIV